MPRRKKRWWKPRVKTESIESIFALLFIIIGVVLEIALFGGTLGASNSLNDLTRFLLGSSAFFLPVVLVILGLNLTKFKNIFAQPRTLWASFLVFVGLVVFFGSVSKTAGGWMGTTVGSFLAGYITLAGAAVIGLSLMIIGGLLGANMSLNEVVEKIQPMFALLPKVDLKRNSEDDEKKDDSVADVVAQSIASESKEEKGPVFPKIETQSDTISEDKPQEDTNIEILEESSTTSPQIPATPAQEGLTAAKVEEAIANGESLPAKPYSPPPLDLLTDKKRTVTDQSIIQKNAQTIEATLSNFGIQARIAEVNLGPAVTQYAINLAEGTRSSKITSLQNDLALALASPTGSVRIESPIPGKRLIGIEVPNMQLTVVRLKEMLLSPAMQNDQSKLAVALGEDVSGKPVVAHIDKWPHILIAGATGSGKSILIHAIINSVLFRATPDEVRFIMVDPKRVELTQYNKLPHLQTPVIVDADRTVNAFKWAVQEMERRYKLFQQLGARNLESFNKVTDTEKLPYIVIIVDELADLMMYAGNEMETLITRIAQKARATGIHMILSTQRPSVDVITGLIKANIPSRIALNVSSSTDSRVILDMVGADKLLGKGDMLYLPPDAGKPKRVQGVFISSEEVARITDYMSQFEPGYKTPIQTPTLGSSSTPNLGGEQGVSSPTSSTSIGTDPIEAFSQQQSEQPDDKKFIDALQVVLSNNKASASLLQRKLKIGYARAARLIDELEERGFVGTAEGSNAREVYQARAKEYLQKMGRLPE